MLTALVFNILPTLLEVSLVTGILVSSSVDNAKRIGKYQVKLTKLCDQLTL